MSSELSTAGIAQEVMLEIAPEGALPDGDEGGLEAVVMVEAVGEAGLVARGHVDFGRDRGRRRKARRAGKIPLPPWPPRRAVRPKVKKRRRGQLLEAGRRALARDAAASRSSITACRAGRRSIFSLELMALKGGGWLSQCTGPSLSMVWGLYLVSSW